MTGFLFVFFVLIVIACVIVFVVKAFLTSILWGLGVFFVPFVEIIFAVKHWDRVNGTVLTFFAAWVGIFLVGVVGPPDDSPLQQEIASEQSELSPPRAGLFGDSEPATSSSTPWQPSNSSVHEPRPARGDQGISAPPPTIVTKLGARDVEEAPYYEMGTQELLANIDEIRDRRVRVVYGSDRVAEGYPEQDGDQLLVSRRQYGGHFSVHVPIADIQSIEVVR